MLGLVLVVAVGALGVAGLVNLVRTAPPSDLPRGARGAPFGVWCPLTRNVQRVRAGRGPGRDRRLVILWCDRWAPWPVGCGMSCLDSLEHTAVATDSRDVRQTLQFPIPN